MQILYVLDSGVAITADRVAATLSNNCLMQLLIDLLRAGMLFIPPVVRFEICGISGENCNSAICKELCTTASEEEKEEVREELTHRALENFARWLSMSYGLDIGEAEAIAYAANALSKRAVERIVVLTADSAARRAIDELKSSFNGLEAHGDLYVIELAKKLGYCSPREAAEIAISLPRLKRYIRAEIVQEAAARLATQDITLRA